MQTQSKIRIFFLFDIYYNTFCMEIKAEKIVFGGDCIGKIDGKTVFVSGMLPGETAEIKILQSKKDYDKAIATKIIESSPHRVNPKCPFYGKCGGCNLQIAESQYQITLRKEIFTDCFRRSLKDDFSKIPEIQIVTSKDFGYRNRFQFVMGGLQEKSQNKTVKIDFCPIAVEKVNYLLKNNLIPTTKDRLFVFDDKTSLDTETYSVNVLDCKITFDVRGFFQSNISMLEKTIPLLLKDFENLPENSRLLDMYAGVGTLSCFAQKFFQEIYLVEHNKKALAFAKENLENNDFSENHKNKKILTFSQSGEKFVSTKWAKEFFDVLIIDPPRSGIEKPVLSWIVDKKIPIIRYLSCDPVTHSRDAKILLEAGYQCKKLYLLDFYPQTSHIESLSYFEYLGEK